MLARLALLLALALAAPAAAQAQAQRVAAPRSEIPIRQSVLSNGALRYSLQVRVGSRALEAVLDTGSGGLRILPGVLGPTDATASETPEVYGYASGSRYEGVAGRTTLTLGDLKGPVPVHLIRAIGCFAELPHCPASRVPLALYGIASDGLPREGFKVILGTDMSPGQVGNPLAALGVRRWIVELPRPGEAAPGRLILNPTAAETEGFVIVPLSAPYAQQRGGGLHDAVTGCLSHDETHERACGAVLMDTGSPSLAVVNARLSAPHWADGAAATLTLFDAAGGVAASEALTLGAREQATRFRQRQDGHVQGVAIYAGVAPYLAYAVLYDMRRQRIGLKPRPAAPAGPRALATTPGS
jgi:hypothetical protein